MSEPHVEHKYENGKQADPKGNPVDGAEILLPNLQVISTQ